MASFLNLWRKKPSANPEGFRTFRHKLAIAAFLLAAAAGTAALALSELASFRGNDAVHSTPEFLTRQLGPLQPDAKLVRAPASDLRVSIREHGFTYSTFGEGELSISATGVQGGAWQRHENGTLRTLGFGREAVTIDGEQVEHFITVDRHLGKRTWKWRLDTTLEPRLSPNGYVGFFDASTRRLSSLELLPAKIFDRSGKDITPKGTHWELDEDRQGPVLTLALDDRRLPLPYTIDPMASRGFAETATTGVSPKTATLPATVQLGDLIIVHVGLGGTGTFTAPTVNGVTMANTLTASNASTLAKQQTWWSRATATDFSKTVSASWSAGNGALSIAVYAGMDSTSPITTSGTAYANATTNASFRLANANVAVAAWPQGSIGIGFSATAANNTYATAPAMATPVGNWTQRNQLNGTGVASADWDYTCATAGGCAYTSANVSSGANTSRAVGNLVVLKPDTTAPSGNTLSINETGQPAMQYFDNSTFNSGNQTCATATCYYYYSPPGGTNSTFTINSVPVDNQSGPNQVAFPTLATTGFTGTGGTTNYQASGTYTSGVFTIANTNAAAPGNGTITASDNNGQSLATTLTFVRDATAPAGGAFSANGVAATGGGTTSYLTSGTTLTINSRTDYTETQSATAAGLLASTLTMTTASLTNNVCGVPGAPVTISGTTSQVVASGNCYVLTLTGTDNVGNVSTVSTTVMVDTTNPSAPGAFSFSGLSANAYWPGSGSIVYFQPGTAGSFTATASGATDADTGVASYTYGPVGGTGWSNTLGAYSYTGASTTGTGAVTATNGASLTGSSTSFTAQADATAPAGGALTANGIAATFGGSSSYLTSGTTLTIDSRTDYTESQTATASGLASSVLTIQSSPLAGNVCTGYGAPTTITGTTSQTVASGNCYLLILKGTDNVGNTTSVRTEVMVDTTAPSAPSAAGFSFGSLTNAYFPGTGSIVYFKGGSAGGFTATASGATDADTGVSSYTYGAIAGAGWGNSAGGYTFTAASPTGTGSVTATNGAGVAGAGTSFTAQSDSTAPAGGAFSANSTAATGGGSSSYLTSGTTLTINSRTDYTESQTATASGLASSTLTMRTGTLNNDACSGYGAPATITGTTSQTVVSGNCYELTLTGTDHVGNVSTLKTTVKVDTTAPSAPSATGFSFGSLTNAYWAGGSSSKVYVKSGSAGGFTVTASGATDADTGVASYAYGAIAGSGWGNTAGAYTFTGASPTGTGAVTATNNAGLTGAGTSFTAQSDGTSPTGGAFSANGQAASGGGTSSYLTSGTTLTINSRTDYAEAQSATESGLASSTLTIETATLTNDACGGYGAPSTITGTTSQTVASGNCYRLTLTGTDNVGNAVSVKTVVKVDTSAPSAPSATGFSFGSLTNAYWAGGGSSKVYYRSGFAGGFTVTASGATDGDTTVASYGYGAVAGSGWANTNGAYTFTGASPTGTGAVTATNNAGLTGASTSFTAQADASAPTGGAFTANGQAASGGGTTSYLSSGTTLTIDSRTDYTETQNATESGLASSTLTIRTATLTNDVCGVPGAPATITGTTSQTVASGNCYELTLTGTDNVGNATSVSTVVKVDTTAPSAPSATGFSFGSLTNAYWAGGSSSKVYFKSGGAGGFTVTASGATDADTAVASYGYGAVGGGGWSNTNGAYTFTAAAASTQTGAVTATNTAGLTGASASFTAQADANAPTGGAFSANGQAASGGGSTSYLTSGTTLTINSRTDYSETQNATESGLASSTLTMRTGTLANDACSAYGAPATITGTTSQTVASGNCYLLTLTGTDNVGNSDSTSTVVKVDTTAPSAPSSFSFGSLTNAYFPGSGSKVYFKSGSAGGFTATAGGSADADSDVASYGYGAIAGTGWGNTAGAYTFTAASPTGTGAVTATNNAGLTGSSASFTAQADANAPTGGAFSANGTAGSGGGSSSYLTSGTTLTIDSRTNYTESQSATESGLASSTLTIRSATLTGDTCGSYGAPATITGTTSQTVASGNCYLLTLTGTDNVGNADSISTVVKVDTTAPSAPGSFAFGSLTNAYFPGSGSIVYFRGGSAGGFTATASGSADADTGVTGYTYGALGGTGWSNTNGAYTFTAASGTQTGSVTATNGAGVAGSGANFTAQADTNDPTGGALSANGTGATGGGTSGYLTSGTTLTIDSRTDYAETQDATHSGLASSTLTIRSATLSADNCGSYGAPSTITGTTSQTVASGNCYLLTLTGTDNVGNAVSISTEVKVDTTAPSAPSAGGFSVGSPTNAYFPGSGTVVYFKGGSAGGFTLSASGATDADTGIASYGYPSLGSGWSNTGGAYTFTGAAGTQSGSATATNSAGLTGAGTGFTAEADTTAPAGGAVSVNGTAASGAGTSSFLTSGTTVTIDSRTNYAETQTATASGLASSVLTIESATLTGNTCGTYGAPTTVAGTTAQTVASGNCYRFTLTGTDNVGNVDTIKMVVKVDTTAPSAPGSFSFSSLSASAYWPGSGSVVYFQTGSSGSFTVAANGAADADTGVASYGYPALGGAGWSHTAGDYSYTSAATTQSGSVTATNNAGVTGAGTSFTAQADGTAPTVGAFSANGTAASAGGSASYLTSGTTLAIDSRTNFTETQTATAAGLASSTLTIKTGTLSGNSCSGYGGPATIVGTTSQTVTSGNCYLLTLTGTDNVGNSDAITTVVKVDTSAPSAPSAFAFSSLTQAYYPGSGSTLFFRGGGAGGFTVTASGSADADTGVTGYTYPALGTGWSNTNGSYTFTAAAGTQSGNATAQNAAGASSAGASFTAQADAAAPTSSIQCNVAACSAGWYTASPVAIAIAAGGESGASGVKQIVYTTDGTDPTSSGTATTVAGNAASFNVTALGTTTIKWVAEDNVGNVSGISSQDVKLDTSNPSAPSAFSFSSPTQAYYPGTGSTVYFKSGGTGGFTVSASGATDAQSGISTYSYGGLGGGGWSNTGGAYTFSSSATSTQSGSVTATNGAGLTGAGATFTAEADAAAPTSAIQCNVAACSAGWYTASPVAIAISTGGESGASGVQRIKVTTDGTDPASSGTATTYNAATASFNVTALGTTTIKWVAEDNVGNVSTVSSQVVKLDTTDPSAPTTFAFSAPTNAYYPGSGSVVYFQGGGTGGFTVTASGSTDADSGIGGYTYPALGTGWAHTGGDYTFDATATTQSGPARAQNNAGLISSGTTFTAQGDFNAPSSAIQCNTATCAASWYTASPVAIDISTGGESGASGTKRIKVTTDGTDPASSGTATTYNAAAASFNLTTLGTTTIKWVAEDNVGNVSAVSSQAVKLDTTAPTAPTLAFSAPTRAYYPGSGSTVFFQSGATGGFTVTASGSTDGDSGVAGYTYPALGTGWSNANGAYSFGATAATDSGSVTAQNDASLSSAGTGFTAEADGAAPTSSIQCNTAACSAGWYTASPVAIDIAAAGEAGKSGVMRIVYTTDGTDPTINASDVVTNGTAVTGNAASFDVTTLGQTTVKWIAEDNVGNVSTVSSQLVKLDTSAPSAPTTFSFTSPTDAYYPGSGTQVFFKAGGTGGFTVSASGAADAQSGVSGYTYPGLGSGWSNTGGAYTFTSSAGTESGSVTAENGAGLSSTGTSFTAEADGTAPTSSATCNTAACSAGWYSASPVTVDISAGGESGASGVKRIKVTTDGTDPTSSGTATTFNAATASVDVTALGTTTVKWVAEDNVGNVSAVSSQAVKLDTTAPTAPPTFAFSSLTNAYYSGAGHTIFFKGGATGGFSISASGSADAESGVTGYTYPALGTGWAHTAGDYTFDATATTDSGNVRAQNAAGLTSTGTTFTAQGDFNAPSSSATCNTAACSTGWYTASPVTVDIATAGEAGASGVKRIKVTTDGTDPTSSGTATTFNAATASVDVTALGTTTVKWVAEDNVGNVSAVSSQAVKLDTTAPSAPSSFSFSALVNAYYPGTGTKVFFQTGATGSFTATASGSVDGESGVSGYTYPALGTGWSNTNGSYTFTAAAGTESGNATAQNGAALSSTGTNFTAQTDGAAPTSALTCDGNACPGGWTNTSPMTAGISGSDGTGSGVASITYTTDGTDPAVSGTATVVAGATASFQVSSSQTIKWLTTDNVGNVSTTQSVSVQVDTTPPTAPSAFAFSALTQAYYPGTGSTVYFRDGGTGGFTVTASGSTDAQSGVSGYTYAALGGGGWSNTGGAYTFTSSAGTQSGSVTAQDTAGNSSTGTSFTAQADGTAPTSSVQCDSAACSTGWYGASPVSVAIAAADGGAGVKRIKVTTDGTDPTSSGTATTFNAATASVDVPADGTTTVKWVAEDNVGNVSAVSSQDVKLDTSAPSAPGTLAFSAPSKAYWPGTGSTVFFKGGAAGGFTLTAGGSADAHSGVTGYTYPALGSGWSHTAGDYTFTAAAGTQSGDVTAQNGAGLSSIGTSFTAQIDSAAPTSAIQCNTAACAAGWYTASPVSIAIDATDGGAAVKRIKYTTDGTDPASSGTATTVNAASAGFNVTALGTTTVKWVAEDNVGNVSTVTSQDVKLDTTAPSAPSSFSFSALGNAYYPGTGATVYFQGGGTGGFTVTASGSTDGDSGVSGYTYPALGTGWSNTNGAYTFAATAATQAGAVTAQNGAGLSGVSATFTAQSDTAAPTSAIQCNTAACSAGWYTTSPVAIAIDAADGGADVKRILYTTDGTDPTSSGTATTVNAATATFNVTALGTTTIKWVAEDNVGNVSTITTQAVKLDTTAPTAPSLAFSGFSGAYYPGTGSTVFFQGGGTGGFTVTASGSTDAQSGVSGYAYPSLGTGWSQTGGDYAFTAAAGTQSGSVTAQDGAGLSSTGTSFTAEADATAPTSAIQCNTAACSAGWYPSSPVAIAIDAADAGAAVKRILYTTDGTDPTSSGTATTVNAATTTFNVTALGTTTIKWVAEDNVGNVSTVSTQAVKLDTSAPSAPTGFAFSATTNAYYPGTGTKVFFQGGGTGGFTIAASGSADAQSGISGYTYPALGTGWSHTAGDYTFTAVAGTDSGDVTAQNAAGLSSTGTSFTAQADATAPTSAIDCNATACSAGWYTTSPVALAISAADGGADVKRILYTTDGTDPTSSGTATTVNAATATFNVTALGTTTIKWVAEDNVGNVSTVTTQNLKLDTSAPSAPSLGFSAFTNGYYPGTGTIVYFDMGQAGGFTVAGSGSTDAESGVAGYTYGALGAGWSNTNGVYTFSAAADTDSGSVTAQNNAGLTGAGAGFTARGDAAAPTSTITCNASSCAAGWTNAVPVDIAIAGDDGTGAGVKRITYTTDGTDPATSGTATTVNAVTATFQLSGPQTIKWLAVDNLDHASAVQSRTIQVDSTAPSAPSSLVFTGEMQAYWSGVGSTVFFKTGGAGGFTVTAGGSIDTESGIAGYTYPALGTGWTHTGGDYTFDATAATQTGSVFAQNNASLTSATGTSFTAQSDGTAPTSSIQCDTAACSAGWYTSSPVAIAIDAADAGAGIKRILYTTDGTDPASSGTATTVNAATATFDVTTPGTTTIKWVTEDNVGNVSTVTTQNVKLDTTAPTAPTLGFSGLDHAYYPGTGSTLFFQGGGTGGFTVTGSGSTDAQSAVAGYTYPALGTGWSNTAGAYTFTGSAATQTGAVTAQNNAGLSSAATSFTAQADASAPSTSATCEAAACLTSWYVAKPVAVAIAGDDGSGSGVKRLVYTTNGVDPAIDGGGNVTSGTAVAGSSASLSISAEGTTVVKWIAEDNVGNITAVGSKTVKIDTIEPGTTIGSQPVNPSNSATPTFGFTSNEAGSSFECSVDGGAYSACLSPLTLPTLGQGAHTFDVRATDLAGNVDSSPAHYAWTVDTVPPAASMTDPGNYLANTVALTSTSTDVGGTGVASVTFEQRTAGGGTWMPIATLPWDTKTGADLVADGLYDLRVVATDNAGNVATSTPVSNKRVDNTAPVVTIPATNGGAADTVSLTASTTDDDPTPTIIWRVAPAGTSTWQTVPASWDTRNGPDAVADGQYDVKAIVTDWAGNVTTATNTNVTVDNQAPAVSVTAPAGAYVNAAAADPFTVTANATDAGTGVQKVDFFECTTAGCIGGTVTALGTDTTASAGAYSVAWALGSDGDYWIKAAATDDVGHVSTSIHAVKVDRTLPDTNLLTKPGDPTNAANPTFTFSATETTQRYECRLDSGSWTTCSSPHSLAATPADGTHTFDVRAVDLAGNTDASVASWTWREDRTAPTATLTDPAAANAAHAIRGTVALASTTADPQTNGYASGINAGTLTYAYSSDGATWAPIAAPAAWDTVQVTDGVYQMRVSITDNAGNLTVSTVVSNVKIDNTKPVTAQDDPGQYLRLGITLTGTAADPDDPQGVVGSGVERVEFQVSPTGAGTWTTVGTDTSEPYTASFDTTTLADGRYDFRTLAYDVAGNSKDATVVADRLIDNTKPTAAIVDPGANLRNTVTLQTNPAGTTDPGGTNASGIVATDFSVSSDGSTWTAVPAAWNTTGASDGLYDVRVTVRDAAGNVSDAGVVTGRRVDNTKPSTSASGVPAGFASSDVTVTLTPTDAGSGVADTVYQVDGGAVQHGTSVLITAPSNGSNDGTHTITFQSLDVAGNVEATKSVQVQIDATPPACPSCSAADYLSGTVTLTATPSDGGAGIQSVAFQHSADGTTWTTIGTDTTGVSGTYSVPWTTTTPADGAYRLRARITDAATNVSSIDLHPGGAGVVVIDNTAPIAAVGSPTAGTLVSGGSVTISASAGDASPLTYAFIVGGSQIASGSAASTSWDSTTVADGPVQIRVRATDPAGNATTSAAVTVTVDNHAPAPTVNDPGAAIAGIPTISASSDADTATVELQGRVQGSGTWLSLATIGSPFQTPFNTTLVPDGNYELRAVATDLAGHTGTSATRTVLVDNASPSASLTKPQAGKTIGGTASQLKATATDTGSGVKSVEFQYAPAGNNTWTSIATVTGAPWDTTWNAQSVTTGDYDIRILAKDNAGNVKTTTPVTVHVDSSAPSVTFDNPGTSLQNTVTLTAETAGPDAVSVAFQISPAGANTWQTLSTDSAAPWSAGFNTKSVGDGLYDLRAVASDSLGNVGTAVRAGIRIDNVAPTVTSSTPADGTVVPSATAIHLELSEVATLSDVELDGLATVAPNVSGTQVDFATGALAAGAHVLAATLTDASGKTTEIELHFTVYQQGDPIPPVEANSIPTEPTTIESPDGSYSMTMPAGAWPAGSNPSSWVVVRLAPTIPAEVPPSNVPMEGIIEIIARWADGSGQLHQFDVPLDIAFKNVKLGLVPATAEGTKWRMIPRVPTAGELPAGWNDGFYRAGNVVHVLTRHLSIFGMAVDVSPPSAPTGLNGTVNDGRLTLRWTPGPVENASVANFVVFGDDTPLVNLGGTQLEAQVGPYDPADPRTYSVVQTSDIGTTSPRSQAVKVLPRIVGLTLESARAALAAKGFVAGDAVVVDSAQPMGLVVGPANLVTAPVGSTIPLQVSAGSGGAPGTKFVFNVVGTRRLPLSKRNFIGIHIASTRATTLTATLVNAKGARVYTWNEKARAGASIVKLTLPKQARKAGTYTLLWTAVSGTETMRKSITVKITKKLAPKVAATKPVDVILTGESLPRELPIQTAQEQRLIPATSGDTTFSVTGDPKRNVQVIVVDADEYGLSLVHDLRTVFPMVKLIALTNDPTKLSRAIKAGATLALPKKTSTDKLAKVVSSLSGNTPRIPASSGTKRP